MNKHTGEWLVRSVWKAAENAYDLRFTSPPIARDAQPGQFVHVLCGGRTLLRRPISICDVEGDVVRIMFGLMGEGTAELTKLMPGSMLDAIGPLGTGFTIGDASRDVVFVGGGLGVFPLFMAAKRFSGRRSVLLGYRSIDLISMEEEFRNISDDFMIATDDGSFGHKGLVTDLLPARLQAGAKEVFACGPTPMLRAVANVCRQHGVPCQVSLEERMGCGVGACLACAVKAKRGSKEIYAQVCRNGPVFQAQEVFYND